MHANMKIRILFVCTGNICRSPSAEAVMKAVVRKRGLEESFEIDSAGTIGYHAGERADSRMRRHASQRGYDLTSISRKLTQQDYLSFDYIIGMDGENMSDITTMAPSDAKAQLYKMGEFSNQFQGGDVPDPYYGGAAGFEHVLDLLEDACESLCTFLIEKHGLVENAR